MEIMFPIFLSYHKCTKFCQLILRKIFKTIAIRCHIFSLTHTHHHFTALWILSKTTQFSQYQKKPSLTHTYHGHQSSLICFIHLIRSMASSLFNLRAWQSFSRMSLQVFFGLPLGLAPSTSYSIHFFIQSLSSFCITCPYLPSQTLEQWPHGQVPRLLNGLSASHQRWYTNKPSQWMDLSGKWWCARSHSLFSVNRHKDCDMSANKSRCSKLSRLHW